MSVSLTNSKDLVPNSISVIDENRVIDLKELFLSKLDATNSIVGLPVATLDSLQKLVSNDLNFDNLIKPNSAEDLKKLSSDADPLRSSFIPFVTKKLLRFSTKFHHRTITSHRLKICKKKFLLFF